MILDCAYLGFPAIFCTNSINLVEYQILDLGQLRLKDLLQLGGRDCAYGVSRIEAMLSCELKDAVRMSDAETLMTSALELVPNLLPVFAHDLFQLLGPKFIPSIRGYLVELFL